MDPTDIDVFRLAERRLAWVDQRQHLLAQNVANANTPGYIARDMAPFAAELSRSELSRTSAQHMEGRRAGQVESQSRNKLKSPNGNTVSIEDQLARVADTSGTQELTLNLHRRYQSMFKIALGRGG